MGATYCDCNHCNITITLRVYSQWEQRRSSSDEPDDVSLSDHLSTAVEIFRNIRYARQLDNSDNTCTLHEHTSDIIINFYSEYLTPMNKLLCVEEANEEITKVIKVLISITIMHNNNYSLR